MPTFVVSHLIEKQCTNHKEGSYSALGVVGAFALV